MRITKKILFTALFFFVFAPKQFGQLIEKDYYMFPINPGKQGYLAGNMGELRSNHFHAGLDIKTGGVEGLPIYCSADGFISRIKVSAFGYGLALYVQHPNGQTTVYGHLQSFKTDVQLRVIKEQYQIESYEIDVYPTKSEFVVKKGEILGLSGNSGGSGGPHLHWEVRDVYSRVLNPLKAGFSEIKDNIDPVIYKVGFTTLSTDAHIKNEFGFFSLTPTKVASNSYSLSEINAHGEIGISLNANDKLNGTANNNGVSGIEMYVNGKLTYQYLNDKFTFASSKMINQHIEFDRYQDGYGHFHRCYVADGNSLDFYKTDENAGVLKIKDSAKYLVKFVITDAYNNSSTLEFTINGKRINPTFVQLVSVKKEVKTKLFENILRVSVPNNGKELLYFRNGKSFAKMPFYTKNDQSFYTFDLRKECPDSLQRGAIKHVFYFAHTILPNKEFTSYNKNGIIRFGKGDIKDTLYLEYKEKNDVWTIGNEYTPIYQNIKYILKPQKSFANKSKTAVYLNNSTFIGGTWIGNNIEFSTTKMGAFTIKEDAIAPKINLISANSKAIKVSIGDNLSGIKSWRATLDGKYLLMGYRYQTATLTSIKLDNTPLKGLFKIEVEDNVGNKKVFSLQL